MTTESRHRLLTERAAREAKPTQGRPSRVSRSTIQIQRTTTCACGGGCPRCEQNATHASLNEVQKQPGYPLDSESRKYFEPRLGRDLGQVRVNHDTSSNNAAHNLHARAFT